MARKREFDENEALKKAMVKCNFVEDYEIDQITIEIPKEYNIYVSVTGRWLS